MRNRAGMGIASRTKPLIESFGASTQTNYRSGNEYWSRSAAIWFARHFSSSPEGMSARSRRSFSAAKSEITDGSYTVNLTFPRGSECFDGGGLAVGRTGARFLQPKYGNYGNNVDEMKHRHCYRHCVHSKHSTT